MNESVGPANSDDRTDTVLERSSWNDVIAVAFVLGAVAIAISFLIVTSYYSGLLEGLSMLPVAEVRHE